MLLIKLCYYKNHVHKISKQFQLSSRIKICMPIQFPITFIIQISAAESLDLLNMLNLDKDPYFKSLIAVQTNLTL